MLLQEASRESNLISNLIKRVVHGKNGNKTICGLNFKYNGSQKRKVELFGTHLEENITCSNCRKIIKSGIKIVDLNPFEYSIGPGKENSNYIEFDWTFKLEVSDTQADALMNISEEDEYKIQGMLLDFILGKTSTKNIIPDIPDNPSPIKVIDFVDMSSWSETENSGKNGLIEFELSWYHKSLIPKSYFEKIKEFIWDRDTTENIKKYILNYLENKNYESILQTIISDFSTLIGVSEVDLMQRYEFSGIPQSFIPPNIEEIIKAYEEGIIFLVETSEDYLKGDLLDKEREYEEKILSIQQAAKNFDLRQLLVLKEGK